MLDEFKPRQVWCAVVFDSHEELIAYISTMPGDHKPERFQVQYTRPPTDDEVAKQREEHNARRSRYIESLKASERRFVAQAEEAADRLPGIRAELARVDTDADTNHFPTK